MTTKRQRAKDVRDFKDRLYDAIWVTLDVYDAMPPDMRAATSMQAVHNTLVTLQKIAQQPSSQLPDAY